VYASKPQTFKYIAVLHNEAWIDGVELKAGLNAQPDSCVMKFAGSWKQVFSQSEPRDISSMNETVSTVLGNRDIHAGVHMAHSRLLLSAMWQLAGIAILFVIDLNSAYAKPAQIPFCGQGCKVNRKNNLVCRIRNTNKVAHCPSLGPPPPPIDPDAPCPDVSFSLGPISSDDFVLSPGEIVEGFFDNFEDNVDFYALTGYLYDERDRRYEFEDGTAVPCFGTRGLRKCRRNEISCSEGCKSGKCCSGKYRIPCPLENAAPPESDGYAWGQIHLRTLILLMGADAGVDLKAFGKSFHSIFELLACSPKISMEACVGYRTRYCWLIRVKGVADDYLLQRERESSSCLWLAFGGLA
jgi:hypothetical protein